MRACWKPENFSNKCFNCDNYLICLEYNNYESERNNRHLLIKCHKLCHDMERINNTLCSITDKLAVDCIDCYE